MPGFARIVCDGFVAGEPFDACPRQVLRRQVARLAERGWMLQTGIEPEFFLLRRAEGSGFAPADAHDRLDKPSYDLQSLPRQSAFLRELTSGLGACGLDVFQIDHEDAHGQYEINFDHADALTSADNLMLFKLAAQAIAERHGMLFSMMPKPFANQPGSGMHFHVSLWDGAGENTRCLFGDARTPPSRRWHDTFIAGVLAHSAALARARRADRQLVQAARRRRVAVGHELGAGLRRPRAEQPHRARAHARRSLRVAAAGCQRESLPRDGGLIAAGLDGIDARSIPAPACEDDLFELPLAEIAQRGIALLPQSLGEAVDALEASERAARRARRHAARASSCAEARRARRARAPRQRLGTGALRDLLVWRRLRAGRRPTPPGGPTPASPPA